MLCSNGSQGQVLLRQALTVATTGGHGYMKRCHDKMRSELLFTICNGNYYTQIVNELFY